MDYQFPQQLFPSFYNCGPPDLVQKYAVEAGGWGSYHGVLPQGGFGPLSSWTFTSKHQVRGETWSQTEPVVIPLLSPKTAFLGNLTPSDPLNFTEHMQNFFMDHSHDAFRCMSDILGEHFYFRYEKNSKAKHWRGSASTWTVKNFIENLKYKMCHQTHNSSSLNAYCNLLSDVVHDIPPDLLGSLLHEELTEQRDRALFSEGATGGALIFVPFSQSRGCLLYPGGLGLNSLNFHRVALQRDGVDISSSKPVSFQLKAPVRQISCTSLFNDCCVAVRSDHLCGVWRFSETSEPRLLQVVNTKEVSTCVSVSPHILGEILVASESGAVSLWTVGKGLQKVRVENANLYFNAKSSWRWCEFSAHPRVMLYADRTGAELFDIRTSQTSGHTLFRIGSSSECHRGERLLLSRYLGDVHSFHHLITTQHSAYIMDERFPCVPMLKWDHMMKAPPIFCHVIPHSAALETTARGTTKVLLGSQSSQEIVMLQYSGGRVEPCFSCGPPQALLQPKESLRHLPVQIPHRLEITANRLAAPATGLTCIQKEGREPDIKECVCVLQLTEAGDVFYQILEHKLEKKNSSQAPAADRQLIVSDTSCDEDAIGPTQGVSGRIVVPETPDRQQQTPDRGSGSEDSGDQGLNLKRMHLQVFVNEDPEVDEGLTERSKAGKRSDEAEGRVDEEVKGSSRKSKVDPAGSLSFRTLDLWKHWLLKLTRRDNEKKSSRCGSQLFKAETEDLLSLPDRETRSAAEKSREKLRREFKSCMSSRSLLLNGTVSSVQGSGSEPVPDPVSTEEWADELSNRLTVSWQGEELWRAWWQDQLGMTKMTKMEALRSRRRKEKEVKRAAGRRLNLSGSFTSSVGSQAELDDFSSSAGWSSASQAEWSDVESGGLLSQLGSFLKNEGASTPLNIQTDTPAPTPTPTPQRVKDRNDDQQTPSRSRTLPLSQTGSPQNTAASQRGAKRPVRDYLSSLIETQDDASQQDNPLHPAASSQLQIPPFGSLQTRSVFTPSVSSQTLSQASRDRRGPSQGPSQGSQLRKKRSRMGF